MPTKLSETSPPRGLLRWLLRTPIWLFRWRLGWLLGHRFLLLTHTGRKSGQPRQTVLEVVQYDKMTNTFIIASGWGEQADWLRNIQKNPDVQVQSGGQRLRATAERLTLDQAAVAVRDYANHNPIAFRKLAARMIGQPLSDTDADYRTLAQAAPFVLLKPKGIRP
ncbi:MAG: nitroreductase family deazaflavin-dependent oxidoreductase [Caldilineaceae bacterium]